MFLNVQWFYCRLLHQCDSGMADSSAGSAGASAEQGSRPPKRTAKRAAGTEEMFSVKDFVLDVQDLPVEELRIA